jgi:hypothetical protein
MMHQHKRNSVLWYVIVAGEPVSLYGTLQLLSRFEIVICVCVRARACVRASMYTYYSFETEAGPNNI